MDDKLKIRNRIFWSALAICFAVLAAGNVHAEIFKCINESGNTEFSDRPCGDKSEKNTTNEPVKSDVNLGSQGDLSDLEHANDLHVLDRDIKMTEQLIADLEKQYESRNKQLDEMYESASTTSGGDRLRRSIIHEKEQLLLQHKSDMEKAYAILESQNGRKAALIAK